MHSWKYCRKGTEEEPGSHRLVNLISAVQKIFPKLIRGEITKHLENVSFLCVLKEKEEGAKKQELYHCGFQKGKGWEKKMVWIFEVTRKNSKLKQKKNLLGSLKIIQTSWYRNLGVSVERAEVSNNHNTIQIHNKKHQLSGWEGDFQLQIKKTGACTLNLVSVKYLLICWAGSLMHSLDIVASRQKKPKGKY